MSFNDHFFTFMKNFIETKCINKEYAYNCLCLNQNISFEVIKMECLLMNFMCIKIKLHYIKNKNK